MPCVYDELPFEIRAREEKERQILDDATRAACTATDLLVNEFDVDLGMDIDGDPNFEADMIHLAEWYRQHKAADRERERRLTAEKDRKQQKLEQAILDATEELAELMTRQYADEEIL